MNKVLAALFPDAVLLLTETISGSGRTAASSTTGSFNPSAAPTGSILGSFIAAHPF